MTGAAGGTMGGTGRLLAEMLLKRGWPVRALVRTDDHRAAALRAAGAEVQAPALPTPSVATAVMRPPCSLVEQYKPAASWHVALKPSTDQFICGTLAGRTFQKVPTGSW